MYLVPDGGEMLAYGAAAAALAAAVGWACARGRHPRLDAAAGALGATLTLAIAFKAGFVRADTHTQIAWATLGLAGALSGIGPVSRRSRLGGAALAAGALAVLWIVAPLYLLARNGEAPAGLPKVYRGMAAGVAIEVRAWRRFLDGPAAFAAGARAADASGWAAVRAALPLPPLAGSVDVIAPEQSALLANGLDYRPRPSFQDYSTYTAGLIAANRAFYAGPKAPDWVLFGGDSLDDRYPTSSEGALWPELLSRYEPTRRFGPWLALHRRAEPLSGLLGSSSRVDARLGESVAVPSPGPVFARIAVNRTALGRIAAALFRPPALRLSVQLAGGAERSYRFVPALSAGGFLLSPLIGDEEGFALLAAGRGADAAGPAVERFTVSGPPGWRLFYGRAMSVEFRSVTVPPAAPSPDARALADEMADLVYWRASLHALGRDADLDGDDVGDAAPSVLALPAPDRPGLRVGFGVADTASARTDGVCFAVVADAPRRDLWRRCLDPAGTPGDRGPQWAHVALPAGTAGVRLETSCRGSCAWGWAYWRGVRPEP